MTRTTESAVADSGRYRRVSTRMYADERFRQLSPPKPCGQVLWFVLLTGPQVGIIPGLYSIGERGLCELLGWRLAGFRKAWRELERLEMITADWQSRVVWIEKSVRHNPPASPNVVKSWRVALADIPECALKTTAIAQLSEYLKGLGPAFLEAFRENAPKPSGMAFGKPSPKPSGKPLPNQEQDQEQEAGTGSTPTLVRDADDVLLDRFERFFSIYPNNLQREPARMLWLQTAPSEATTREIIAAVGAFRTSVQWADAIAKGELRFIPLAKRFLRDRLWCDAPAVVSPVTRLRNCPHSPRCDSGIDCTARELEAQLHPDRGSATQAVRA